MISTDDISLAFGMVGTSGRTTTYGKVAEAAAKLEPPKYVPLKDPKNWKIAGKGLKRLDSPDKVTGKQVYGADLKPPGMLNAAIKECPVMGGKIKSFDAAADLHHLLHARHLRPWFTVDRKFASRSSLLTISSAITTLRARTGPSSHAGD
jgi:hypothetical protein